MQTPYMLSDSQWEELRTIIEPKARKRKVGLQVIVSGIVYLLENGCKWKHLPACYGYHKTVWYYYNKWMRYGTLEQLLYKLTIQVRTRKQHRKAEPTLVIIDSQSAKTTAGTSEATGYDANKKVKGRKRHIGVDTQGNVVAAGITAASVHDKPGSKTLEEDIKDMGSVKKIMADGAYKGEPPFTAQGRIENGRSWKEKRAVVSKCYPNGGLWSGLWRGCPTSDGSAGIMKSQWSCPKLCSSWLPLS